MSHKIADSFAYNIFLCGARTWQQPQQTAANVSRRGGSCQAWPSACGRYARIPALVDVRPSVHSALDPCSMCITR